MSTSLEMSCLKAAAAAPMAGGFLTGSSPMHHKKELKILLIATLLYILIIFIFNFWKYYTNKYNVLDLAIYNQVFWSLTHGGGLYSSIQQGHYFGDHAEFFIFLLAPFYALLPYPLTLLTLQTIGLASAALPIYFLSTLILSLSLEQKKSSGRGMQLLATSAAQMHGLAKRDLREDRASPPLADERSQKAAPEGTTALIWSLLWLLNPILWNINFFEFHILSFTVPLLLWTIYFLLTGRIKSYFLFLFLSLLVREDVALITLMLGLVVTFSQFHRSEARAARKLIGLMTMAISMAWFFGATKLIQHFSADASYKYLAYYSWLGDSWTEIIKKALLHPLIVIKHLLTLPNFEMILGFLLAFAFLPLLRPKFLWLALVPLLQFILSSSGGGAIIFQIHYAALFLPALIISSIFGLKYLLQKLPRYHFTIIAIAIIVTIYNLIILGPALPSIKQIRRDSQNKKWQIENQLYSMIPPDASVAVTYTPLTKLSSRQDLYALHYLYVGKKQFSSHDYKIPEPPDYLMIDEDELRTFKVQYESLSWSAAGAKDGFKRLEDLITAGNYGVKERAKNLVLLQKNLSENSPYELPKISPDLHGYITLNGFRSGDTLIFK